MAPLSFLFFFLLQSVSLISWFKLFTFFLKKKGKYHPNNACVSNKNFNKLSIVLSKVKKQTQPLFTILIF